MDFSWSIGVDKDVENGFGAEICRFDFNPICYIIEGNCVLQIRNVRKGIKFKEMHFRRWKLVEMKHNGNKGEDFFTRILLSWEVCKETEINIKIKFRSAQQSQKT